MQQHEILLVPGSATKDTGADTVLVLHGIFVRYWWKNQVGNSFTNVSFFFLI